MSSEAVVTSTGTSIGTVLPPRREAGPQERHRLLQIYDRFHPVQGWGSFIILLLALLFIGMSVQDGAWVPIPGLQSLFMISAVVGLGLAKVRIPAIFLHPLGLLIGAALVIWRSMELAEETTVFAALPEMWGRVDVWYEAATNDGISTDLLPFTLMLLSMAWLIGYFSSFFVFRVNNAWVTVVLGGVAVLTNLSFPAPYLYLLIEVLHIHTAGDAAGGEAERRAERAAVADTRHSLRDGERLADDARRALVRGAGNAACGDAAAEGLCIA